MEYENKNQQKSKKLKLFIEKVKHISKQINPVHNQAKQVPCGNILKFPVLQKKKLIINSLI